jgi:integrase
MGAVTREDAAAAEDFTVSDAIARYLTSQQTFGRLASATRKIHRSHLRRFAAAHGTTPFAAIDVDTIEGYLDQQMSAHVSRAAHKVLRALFRFGTKKMRWRADDPTKQIDAPKVKAGAGREPWSDGELRQFEAAHPIGTKARLCFALALYTGQRRGDLRKIQHGDFGDDGTLSVRQQKTGAELYLPVRPELRAIIDASPCGADFLLVTKTGRQFGANDLERPIPQMVQRRWRDQDLARLAGHYVDQRRRRRVDAARTCRVVRPQDLERSAALYQEGQSAPAGANGDGKEHPANAG